MHIYHQGLNKIDTLNELKESINKALDEKNFFLAMFLAVGIPDICSAMLKTNNKGNKARYIAWIEEFIQKRVLNLDDEQKKRDIVHLETPLYYLIRNSIIHEASSNFIINKEEKCFKIKEFIFFAPLYDEKIPLWSSCDIFSVESSDEENDIKNIEVQINVYRFCYLIICGMEQFIKFYKEQINGRKPSFNIYIY